MKSLNILLINMSNFGEWQRGVSNRNFHLWQQLEKMPDVNKILCVDYPPHTWKRMLRNIKETFITPPSGIKILKRGWWGALYKVNERVYVYSAFDFWWRPKAFVSRLGQALSQLEMNDYILWSLYPSIMPHTKHLPKPQLTIFDAVDNWSEHSSYLKQRQQLQEAYSFIKKNTDIIFTVSEDLQKLFDSQANVYWIPNGVDLKHYQKPWKLVNRDIADLPRPIIGYIGVIQTRVDLPLIRYLAEKNPDKSFALCGPVWYAEEMKALETLPNIYFLGYKEYDEAPMYIQQFDVALIPHKKDLFISSTNPMKMYEYLACGKPVVATAGAGAEMFRDEIFIAHNHEEFNQKLQEALEFRSPEDSERRRKLMENYSWAKTVKHMLDIVQKKIQP